ncbi:MAG: tetratricopeptide repeat protein [Pirellulaceae bacterium]
MSVSEPEKSSEHKQKRMRWFLGAIYVFFAVLIVYGFLGPKSKKELMGEYTSQYYKADGYAKDGEWAKAIDCYTRAIEVNPFSSEKMQYKGIDFSQQVALPYYHRGLAYQELGDADKAAADFAKAKELGYEPDDE